MPKLVDQETGQLVDVADHESAVAALQSGTHGLRADAPVNLVDSSGQVVNADAANVGELLGAGYRLADDVTVARDLERQQYGEGLGNEAAAFAEGAASGATMGLSDIAAKAIDDEYAADLVKRREYNPNAAMAGEAAGVIGTAVLSGGAGGVGAVARALPASLAMRGTEALAAQAATRGVQALGQVAIQGALEGALFGASKVVSDDYLNDHEITAERIAMGAGLGGLTGGLFGAGTHAIGSALAKGGGLAKQATSALMGRLGGKGVADDAARAALGSVDNAAGAVADEPIKRGAFDAFAEGATARERFGELQQKAVRELTDLGSENARIFDEAIGYSNVGLKPKAALNAIDQGPPTDPSAAADSLLNEVIEVRNRLFSGHLEAQGGAFREGGKRAIQKAVKELDGFEKEIVDGLSAGGKNGLAKGLIGFDKLKRRLGQIQDSAAKGIDGDPSAQAFLRDEYTRLQKFLEDDALHGPGWANMQRTVNKGWTEYLESANAFEQRFALSQSLRTSRSARDGFVRVADVDGAKIGSTLSQIGKAEADQALDVLVKTPRAQADLLSRLSTYYDIEGTHVAAAAKMNQNAARIASTVEELSRLKVVGDQFDQATAALADIPFVGSQLAKARVSAGRAANLASPAESAAARQAEQKTARASAIHTAAVRAAEKAERLIDGAASAVLKAGKSRTTRSISDSATVLGYEYLPTKAASVHDFADHLDGVLDEQGEARTKVRSKLWNVREVNPAMAQQMEAQAVAAAKFLRDKAADAMPPRDPADMFAHLRTRRQDPAKARRLANYAEVVANPEKAISRLKNGEVRREDVETLRAVYPRMAQRLANAILAKVSESKRLPSAEVQQTISSLTGMPVGRVSPAYTAVLQNLIRTAPTAQALQADRQPRRSSGTPKVASMYSAPSEVNEHM